jgi:rRNA maturation endonuclease Nob1
MIKEELKKLNLDKKSIDKIIINHSLEDIEKKIDLLRIKKNVVNPAGWLIAALKANYLNPESSKEENDEEEKIMETEEVESESKIVKPNKLALKKKEKEEKDRLFMEESLKWIKQNLVQRLEM